MGILIGFSGLANSGKDTCADYLVENYKFAKISLSDPIKRMVMEIYNFSEEQLWGESGKRNKPDKRYMKPLHLSKDRRSAEHMGYLTPREALQKFGGVGRECWSGTWLSICLRNAKKLLITPGASYSRKSGVGELIFNKRMIPGIAIPDGRYKNERGIDPRR